MTVVLLAVGLLAAGVGTAAFLRNSLIDGVDTQVDSLARTDAASPLLDLSANEGTLEAEPITNAPPTDYFVAVYEPTEGRLLQTAGGRGGPAPAFPPTFPLDVAQSQELGIATLPSEDGDTEFRATVTVQELGNTGVLYTQMVAVPLATVNRTIASYIGIYSILAILILVGGAVATRYLVTLTFSSLGQVESTADAIAAGDFSLRMTDIEPTTTEVGRLKTAINAMLDRVDAAISQRDATVRQMRRFIGDASHELRTPSSRCAAMPSCIAWAPSAATRTSRSRWSASRRRPSAWACWSRICSRWHASMSAATSSSGRWISGRSPATPRSTCARRRPCARSP